MSVQKSSSVFWYLLPLFFAIIGGVITYFFLRKSDPKKAKICLIFGVIVTLVFVIVSQFFPEVPLASLIGESAIPIFIGVAIASALYNYLIKKIKSKMIVYTISIIITVVLWILWNVLMVLPNILK